MTIVIDPPVTSDEERVVALVEDLLRELPPSQTDPVTFLGAQFDRGLAWVHFPEGEGGLGLSPKLQRTIGERIAAAGGPSSYSCNPIGVGMCGPTLVEWGTPAQKERYLRPLFSSEEIWCQLFSEPGSGSDFAGVSSRGERDGDEWIVNGQKVWTTLAHTARWGLLVVRTDPDVPKHSGLTAFVVDMHAPGVDVRPLRQMTGEAEFNEVYFADVRIPESARLGRPGDGWRVSLTTLMNERVSIGGAVVPRGSGPIATAVELWKNLQDERKDATRRDRLMQLWVEAEINRLTNLRASQNRKMGVPGPEGSTLKLADAESNKRVWDFCVDVMGVGGTLYGSYDMVRPEALSTFDSIQKAFLRSRANSIEGGTSEIMRNILGERVLGLPGDVRVDRELPWRDVPRN
jgi:alkylation response protein AidB-like acyl-CoA dehydrogenase